MKLINLISIIFFLNFSLISSAQVIKVCAGEENIELHAENYQLGFIEWQKSYDNENWMMIHNENDLIYNFLPTETAYYRAINKSAYCDPSESQVTLIQFKPQADAGKDRIVNGDFTYLHGNVIPGANVTWTIQSGAGGVLETPNKTTTKFTGIPGNTYKLKYKVQNDCGNSSKTVTVKFIENEYYDNLVVVDETDEITSTEAELANGIYKIAFGDPVPEIQEETILIGIVDDGFMRKVEDFTQDGNYFVLNTSEAKLEDIFKSGGLELGKFVTIGDFDETGKSVNNGSLSGMNQLTHMPTRAELKTNENLKTGAHYYLIENTVESQLEGVSMKSGSHNTTPVDYGIDGANEEENALALTFNFDNTQLIDEGGLNIKLDGEINFIPNLVGDIEIKATPPFLRKVNIGVNNAQLIATAKLTATADFQYESESYDFSLYTLKKKVVVVIGGVPTLLNIKVVFNGTLGFSAEGNATYIADFKDTYTVNAGLKYESSEWSSYFNDSNEMSFKDNLTANVGMTGSLEFGPIIYLTINGFAGPYVDTKMTSDLGLCASTENMDFNWGVNFDVGAKLTVGAHAYLFKQELFDKSKTWENRKMFSERNPYAIVPLAGNNQKYIIGQPLEYPLKVQVTSKNGYYSKNAFVTFEVQDESGTVSQKIVPTNSEGIAETIFTPTSTTGTAQVKAFVRTCDFDYITYAPIVFNAIEDGINPACENSSLTASYEIIENNIEPVGHMGTPPYTYSTDLINYNQTKPSLLLIENQDYQLAVKDSNDCRAIVNYKHNDANNPSSCAYSDLALSLETNGTTITAFATGGTPPYLYSINNLGFSDTSVFSDLYYGVKYTVTVKDAVDCIYERDIIIQFGNGGPIPTEGLVAYYPFSGNANDESGNGNHGAITGATFVNGVKGSALRTKGVHSAGSYANPDHVRINNSSTLQFSNAFSISYWIRIEGEQGQGYGAGCGDYYVSGRYGVSIGKSGDRTGFRILDYENSSNIAMNPYNGGFFAGVSEIPSGFQNWRHMVYIIETDKIIIYVNGVLLNIVNDYSDFARLNTQDLYIGAEWNFLCYGTFWGALDGMIDEVRIYNRTLTEAEVQALANE